MSQNEIKPWVLVSNIKENTTKADLERISPLVTGLVDEWQSMGKIMWSGAFDNAQSSMAVFEATETEARQFLQKYEHVCSNILIYYLYQWDAMPILSMLSK